MASDDRKLRRRLLLIAITAVAVCVLGYGAYRVYKRGLQREGVYERAEHALRNQNFAEAIRGFREALAAEPGNLRAREFLLFSLDHEGQLDEMKRLAEQWAAEGAGNEFASRTLCELALRRGDYNEADRLARALAETQPDFGYQVLALVQDHVGIAQNEPRFRLEAAATMRGLASVTQSEGVKADSLVFAAAVTLEVLPPGAARSPRLMERVRQDLQAAVAAATQARQKDSAFAYEMTMGRIRILSEDETEAALGADTLRKYVSGVGRSDHAIAALALYHGRRQEWSESVDLVRELKDTYLWQRVFSFISKEAPHEFALAILESGPERDRPERRLARADLLLRSENPAEKDAGREIVEEFLSDPASETGQVLASLQILAMRVDLEAAREAALRTKLVNRPDTKIKAFLASLLASSEEDKEEALGLAERLAAETDSTADSNEMIRLLGGQGAAFDRYIESQVAKGGAGASMHRLTRALSLLSRNHAKPDTEEGAELRSKVEKDLDALLADPTSNRATCALSFQMAAMVGAREKAGMLLGRAVALTGEPDDLETRVLDGLDQMEDRSQVAPILAGVRAIAPKTGAPAFVEAFASALELRGADRKKIPDLFEEAAGQGGSRVRALTVAARLRYRAGDLDGACRIARTLLSEDPSHPTARDILSAAFLREKKYTEILDLYKDVAKKSVEGYSSVVAALYFLDRKPEALKAARAARDAYPTVPLPYVVLAQLYIDLGDRNTALSILSIAPSDPYILHLRADMLMRAGDYSLAAQLYESLLVVSTFRDREAWTGLYQTLLKQGHLEEFQLLSSRVLAGEFLKDYRAEKSHVFVLRGMSLETDGKLNEALTDYENAIVANGNAWEALNNAAWHIAKLVPARIDIAKGYIARARALRPGDATILDTAAEVYGVAGDFDEAFTSIDGAIAGAEGARKAKYMLHKALLLQTAGRLDDVKALLETLVAAFPDDPSGKSAKEMLWEKAEAKRLAEEAKREEEERQKREAASPPDDG